MTGKSPHRRPPGKIRRLFLVLAGVLLAAAAALAIGVVYLARNPSAVKPLVEKTLSAQTGASVRIERLNLGTDPLRLDAQGISVSPGGAIDGFHLYAAALTVRANLSGSFGGRTLSIDLLRLENYTGRFTPQMKLPTRPAGRKPSLPGRLLQRLVRLLLFSELAFQRVEALNGELVFTTAHQQARMTIASILSDPDGGVRLDADARLESDDGRQLIELPEVQVDIAPPGLTTTRSVSGRIQLSDGRIDGGRITAAGLTGTAAIRYDRNLKKIDLAGLSLRARMATGFRAKEIRPNEFVASLQADASYQLPNAQLEVSRWSLDCENLLNLSGSARLQAGPAYPFRLLLTGGRLDAAGLMRQLAPSTDHGSMPLSISGPVDIVGDVEGRFGEPPEKWNGSLRASLDRMPLAFRANPYQVKGRVGGKVQLTGSLLDPLLQAELTATEATVTGSPVELDPFEADIVATGRYPQYRTDLHIRAPRVQLKTDSGKYRLRQVVASAENGSIDLQSGETLFPAVAISSATLRNLSVQFDKSKQGLRAVLDGSDTRLTTAAVDWGLIPSDWQVGGSDRISATVIVDEHQQVLVTSKVVLSGVSAASPDERSIIDGLQASADVNLRWRPDKRQWSSVAQLSVDKGEALLGRYYHNFNTNSLTLSGRGQQVLPSQQIALDGIRLQLKGLLGLQAYGSVSTAAARPTLSATVLVPETELIPLYRHFILEPYKFENPSLEKLSFGGRISGELQLANLSGSWSARGRLIWREGHFSTGDQSVSATGIELDFPVWHQQSPAEGPALPGSLRIAAMRLPLMPQQPLLLPFKAGPGTLTTTAPVDIEVGDGKLNLGPVLLRSVYSGRPELTTSLSVDALKLDTLLGKAGGVCSGGQLNGSLDRVELAGSTVTGRGRLIAAVCGGRVEIRNPGIGRLFSSSPAIRFDAAVETLDLEQLTAGTSFGRIQGVLNGWVRQLEIVNGQPQSFDLLLETMQAKGIPQKINVRAVENIARLGGGGSPFMGLAGTVVTLFKEFSYSKIGVRARLHNDTFRINGIIREDGKEYLVKKGGLSGVDVVNLNPDNRISFKDMVKRIKRIQQSGTGPVIK